MRYETHITYQEKSEGFANQTFRLLLVGRSRSGFSSPDSDTFYTLGLAVETIIESSMTNPPQIADWSTLAPKFSDRHQFLRTNRYYHALYLVDLKINKAIL